MGHQPKLKDQVGVRLGLGGFSTVSEFRHSGSQPLAVKISCHEYKEKAVELLQREANVLACLNHPNIVKVYGLGTCPDPEMEEGRPVAFMVMDLLRGHSLEYYLKKTEHPFSPLGAFMLARQVAEALGAVHRAGLVYEDLKPGNIILTKGEDKTPKVVLVDFSLAERIGWYIPPELISGTIGYISPEKAQGWHYRCDRRSDIFSLGATLYELIYNKVPITLSVPILSLLRNWRYFDEMQEDIQSKPLAEPFKQVLLRLTAIEMANRYQSCAEVVNAIDSAVASLR